jgi:hypothetical protein
MSWVAIDQSAGRNGNNRAPDVAKIGAASVAVGPDCGGTCGPPLTPEGLGQAIAASQRLQHPPAPGSGVWRGRASLRRSSKSPGRGAMPPPPPTPVQTATMRPMRNAGGLATAVDHNTDTPSEASLLSEFVFQWGSVAGKGKISYFELDQPVIPRWFGVLVPDGVSSFDKAHIFFHPTPGQGGYDDANYQALGNWSNLFYYLSSRMGAQFCAAGTGRVMVMPLMTWGTANDCGILPQRWEPIVSRIFGMLKSNDMSGSAPPASISDVVVSSFSSGITYSHHFRNKANLGARLAGVIDLDGRFSQFGSLSEKLGNPKRLVRMQQMPATQRDLARLLSQSIIPLGRLRWDHRTSPYRGVFPGDDLATLSKIHRTVPQTMMFIAARRAG